MNRKTDTKQVARMLEMFSAAETARRLEISERQIRRIKARIDSKGKPIMTHHDPGLERTLARAYRDRGESLRDVADRFGWSHEQIRIITEEAI